MFRRYYVIFTCFICIICIIFSFTKGKSSSALYFPLRSAYTKTSNFGYRTLGSYHFHNGIDLAAKTGTPVYALSAGTVVHKGFYSSYGNCVIISYYNGYKSLYGHLSSKYNVEIGQSVSSSNIIGTIGPKYLKNGKLNGMTTGPHLHFALYRNNKLINPSNISFLH